MAGSEGGLKIDENVIRAATDFSKRVSPREKAEFLGINEGKVSNILHNRIDKFSTD